jgi:hypothetical protein
VVGCCEYGDEPFGSGAIELVGPNNLCKEYVSQLLMQTATRIPCFMFSRIYFVSQMHNY